MGVLRCLRLIQNQSDGFRAHLLTLSPEAWDGSTNCPPWRVRDLAAHVVASGEGFVHNVRRGLAGSAEPSTDTEASQRRRLELEAADPVTLADALADTTTEFISLYDGLSTSQLDALCFHRRGNRSVSWYAAHRLAEIAFHSWDLELSTEQTPKFDDQVAAVLLPTLLESNLPRTYAAGLSRERGRGQRFLLAVANDPLARWLITIDPDSLTARRAEGPADLTIT